MHIGHTLVVIVAAPLERRGHREQELQESPANRAPAAPYTIGEAEPARAAEPSVARSR